MPASSKEFLDIQANYRVWIHSETRMGHDNNIQLKLGLILAQNKQSCAEDKLTLS